MRNNEINLLEVSNLESPVEDERKKKDIRSSILLLVFFALIIASIFGYIFYLQDKAKALSLLVLAKEQEIESMKDKEVLYRIEKSKLKGASQIIDKRPDLIPVLEIIENTTPKGIVLESIGVPVEDKISLTGKAVDAFTLANFFSTLSEGEYKKYFKQITLNNLSYIKGRGYSFDLLLLLVAQK